jgi:hypothetical protein
VGMQREGRCFASQGNAESGFKKGGTASDSQGSGGEETAYGGSREGRRFDSQERRRGVLKSRKEGESLVRVVYRSVDGFLNVKKGREGMLWEDQGRRTMF